MSKLAIDLQLLTGTYEAQEPDGTPEWPPHPYRLVAALIAAAGSNPTESVEACLRVLSELGPPTVYASPEVSWTKDYTSFVPGSPTARGLRKMLKPQPVRADRCSYVPEPTVRFEWATDTSAEGEVVDREVLAILLGRIGHLGRCSGVVIAHIGDAAQPLPGLVAWEPDPNGPRELRIAVPGTIQDARKQYAVGMGERPVCGYRNYRKAGDPAGTPLGGPWSALVCYQLSGKPPIRIEDVMAVCEQVRAAAMPTAQQCPEISGHEDDGSPTTKPHIAWVPLVNVGYERSDGTVLGIGVALPDGVAAPPMPEELTFQGYKYKLTVPLDMGPSASRRASWALQEARWTGLSATWATATPIALPRLPAKRTSRNTDGTRYVRPRPMTRERLESAVVKALKDSGFPEPVDVVATVAPVLKGTVDSRAHRARRHHDNLTRLFVHAEVRFPVQVRGPVIVGAYRHFGMGLMAPVNEEDALCQSIA